MKVHTLVCPVCDRPIEKLPGQTVAQVPRHPPGALAQVCMGSGMTVATRLVEHTDEPTPLG